MYNGNNPAMPASVAIGPAGDLLTSLDFDGLGGLTKREYYAAMAMQGLCSGDVNNRYDAVMVAKWAVEQADALLAALEQK